MINMNAERRVIFLDLDGVLVTPHSISKSYEAPSLGDALACRKNRSRFSVQAVELLNQLTVDPRVELVLSSTWRGPDVPDIIAEGGVKGRWASGDSWCTPWIDGDKSKEIDAWLEKYASHYDDRLHSFVILDDENRFTEWQKEWLVKTVHREGLQQIHYEEVRRLLNL